MRLEIDQAKFAALPLEERAKVEQALRELEYRFEWDPLSFYAPHPKQKAFHFADAISPS